MKWTTAKIALALALGEMPTLAVGQWLTNDRYPPKALLEHREGTVYFTATIGTDGRPKNCVVTKSSGSADLDEAACQMVLKRARFIPAKDDKGNAIESQWSRHVTFKLPN